MTDCINMLMLYHEATLREKPFFKECLFKNRIWSKISEIL